MVDNARGEYKWQTPIAQDLPYIVADIEPANDSKGIDGTLFKIKINKRTFGHGDIITYDKYNGLELYITAEDIIPAGDGYVYTVQLVNNNNAAILDNKYKISFIEPDTSNQKLKNVSLSGTRPAILQT